MALGQLLVVEAILKASFGVKTSLKVTPPLYRGGDFDIGRVIVNDEQLHWDQRVPEKQRYGFNLLDKVEVIGVNGNSMPDSWVKGGYVVAWHPSKYYPRVYIAPRPQLHYGLRTGFAPELLRKVE